MTALPTIEHLAAELAAGRASAAALTEAALARAQDLAGEGARVFTVLDAGRARALAAASDALRLFREKRYVNALHQTDFLLIDHIQQFIRQTGKSYIPLHRLSTLSGSFPHFVKAASASLFALMFHGFILHCISPCFFAG